MRCGDFPALRVVAPHIAIAEIVGEDNDYIRLLGCERVSASEHEKSEDGSHDVREIALVSSIGRYLHHGRAMTKAGRESTPLEIAP